MAALKRVRNLSKLERFNEHAQAAQVVMLEYLSSCMAYPGDLEGGGGGIIMDDGSTVSGARFDTLRSSFILEVEDIFSNRTDLAVKKVAATKPANTSFFSLYVKLVSEKAQLLRDSCEDELSRLKQDAQTALSMQAAVLDQANAAAGNASRGAASRGAPAGAKTTKDTPGAKGNQRQRANAKKAEAEAENAALRAQLAESRHAGPNSPPTPGISAGGHEDHSPPGGGRTAKAGAGKAAAEAAAKKKAAAAAAAGKPK